MVGGLGQSHPFGRKVLLLVTGEANRLTVELGHIDRVGDRPTIGRWERLEHDPTGGAPGMRLAFELANSGVLVR